MNSQNAGRYVIIILIATVLSACVPRSQVTAPLSCPTATPVNQPSTQVAPTTTLLPTAITPSPTYVIDYPTPPPWDYSHNIVIQAPVSQFENNSPFEIVEYLYRQDMERFKDSSVPEGQRIIAYKIEAIDILHDWSARNFRIKHPAKFIAIADISFSVIPARYIYSDWIAGNGTYHPGDVWISGKSAYYALVEKDSQYLLISIGTSL
jgi:hypothetical protein